MNILIIDQCCKRKEFPKDCREYDRDEVDRHSREELIEKPNSCGIPARDLYQGLQQCAINRAVDTLRADGHSVTRLFISAGFGVVKESTPLPPYNVTFKGMRKADLRERAEKLHINSDLLDIISTSSRLDVAFLPLGGDYFQVIDLDEILQELSSTSVVLFNQESRAEKIDRVLSLPARNQDASEYGVNAIELKGHYIERFSSRVTSEGPPSGLDSLNSYCREDLTSQVDFERFD